MAFKTTLSSREMATYIGAQLSTQFPDGDVLSESALLGAVESAYRRCHTAFSNIRKKYFCEGTDVLFDHLHGDQMCMFLYYLGNSIFNEHGHHPTAKKTFLLNKMSFGLDAFYSIQLPEVFCVVHPVGTVLGNAKYGNFFTVYQNCTIGADGIVYPEFGEGVIMYSRTSVLADSKIGSNVIIGANAFLLNTSVPSNSVVVGQFPNLKVRPLAAPVKQGWFGL